jgi:transcription-repair coupling factor (superfamily II helicase)
MSLPNDTAHPEITHATVRSFVEGVRSGLRHGEVLGLIGSSGAYFLAKLLAASDRTILVLAAGQKEAARFADDLAFYHGRPGEVFLFPHWEVRPYEALSPHPEVEASRLAALAALHEGRARAVVLTVRALMQRVLPREALTGLCERLITEEEYPRRALLGRLLELGYASVPLVEDRGTFSARGDILDIFPPTRSQPVRIEFFGDYVERMRPFNAATQRSLDDELEELVLLPAREMVLAGEHLETFARRLKERCDSLEISRPQREAILEEAREGILAPGRSFLLPLNYAKLDTFFDYAPGGDWVVLDPPAVEGEADIFAAEVREGEKRIASHGEAFAPAADFFLPPELLESGLSAVRRIDFSSLQVFRLEEDRQLYRINAEGNGDIRAELHREGGGMAELADRLRQWQQGGWRLLLVCHTRGQAERLLDLLQPYGLSVAFDPSGSHDRFRPGETRLVLGDLSAGFRLPDEKLAVVTEEEIFGQRVRRRGAAEARAKALLSTLAELREGDYVVHADHGIARYRGLLHLQLRLQDAEALVSGRILSVQLHRLLKMSERRDATAGGILGSPHIEPGTRLVGRKVGQLLIRCNRLLVFAQHRPAHCIEAQLIFPVQSRIEGQQRIHREKGLLGADGVIKFSLGLGQPEMRLNVIRADANGFLQRGAGTGVTAFAKFFHPAREPGHRLRVGLRQRCPAIGPHPRAAQNGRHQHAGTRDRHLPA